MCLAVYIASDHELPEISWDETDPQFYVEIIDSHEEKIDRHLTLPQVAYAGSNQGCGCGFLKPIDMPEELLEPNELEESQLNYNALASYIADLRKTGASCEIYVCWEGDQAHPSEFKSRITTEKLASRDFVLEEKTYYELA
jgi:hypothetical protein